MKLLLASIVLFVTATVCAQRDAYAGERPDPASSSASSAASGGDTGLFSVVRSLLETKCVKCHGANEQESDLRLDQLDSLRKGGVWGPAVVPGKPGESLLLKAIRHADDELQMPPDEPKLPDATINAVEAWISAGAYWPPQVQLRSVRKFTDEERQFWSFRPLADPLPPQYGDDWVNNEIDCFIGARLQAQGIAPAPKADARVLVRRLYLDLWGIPPTPEQTETFLADRHPQAYERLVDKLLRDDRYGQRFARQWLDLVRYAESDGFKTDVYRPNAWRYRDYVIRSLNADKPYNRFVHEQLAGDELYPGDVDARIATGFLRLWPLEDNQKDVRRQWTLALQDVTEVTGEVFMGLGMKCARCHDHKFDPILQKDYYRLQAFFAAMLPRDDLSIVDPRQIEALQEWEHATREVRLQRRRMPSLLASRFQKSIVAFPAYLQHIYQRPVAEWTPLYRQYAYLANPQVGTERKRIKEESDGEYEVLQRRVEQLNLQLADHNSVRQEQLAPVMCVTDVGPEAPPTYIGVLSDDFSEETRTEAPIEPGFLSLLDPGDAAIEPIKWNPHTTGRRATLARWLTREDHPLTARVMVNRIWQSHFGVGIVATANDFGKQGVHPSHPELLDWLSRRFVEGGWSLKNLHRLVVTSATYCQSKKNVEARLKDPENRLLSHFPSRRLDAEQLRDAMLAVSGELDVTDGGPSVLGDGPRRSVYVRNVRNTPDEMLNAFDGPDMFNSCARRFVTTTPLQSLLLLNSDWSLARAEAFASSIQTQSNTDSAQEFERINEFWVTRAYLRSFSRVPDETELAQTRDFFAQYESSSRAQTDALVDYCHVILCSNEFIYVE